MKEFFRPNKKILYWIILVIVVLVVGGMIWFQGTRIPSGEIPTTEKTAVKKEEANTSNWQIYRNEEYGLEVRYPEGWYVVTEYMKDINNIIRGTNTSFYDEKNNFRIALDNPGKEIGRGMDLSLLREEKIENSGITITKFISETSTSDKDFLVLARWSGNGTAGEFVYWYSNSGGKYPNETIPNQILSTFRFIEPSPQIDTSNWQTYRNEEFGFEVKYPSNWSWEENGNATFFLPPQVISKQESISIVIINYKETPPLPVQYIYKTIRTVQSDNKQIPVQEREPSSVTELYIAEIKKGDYTAEFRFSLDRKYDDVFDNMLSTFKFIEIPDISDWQTYRNEEYGFEIILDDRRLSILKPNHLSYHQNYNN